MRGWGGGARLRARPHNKLRERSSSPPERKFPSPFDRLNVPLARTAVPPSTWMPSAQVSGSDIDMPGRQEAAPGGDRLSCVSPYESYGSC